MLRIRACFILTALLVSGTALAQDEVPKGLAAPRWSTGGHPVGVSLAGGVSLGAYEAGFLHGLLSPLRKSGTVPRVLTGTSAGSINAFVGAVQACSDAPARPTDSLLYKVWIPIGLDKLFVRRDVTTVSALSRAGFSEIVNELSKRFEKGLDAHCDVQLGFAVTRERPKSVPLGDLGAIIPRMTEHVLIRLRGYGPGKAPTIENVTTREIGRHHMLLAIDGKDAHPFDAVVATLLASSGFPLAFPPQVIEHCEVDIPRGQPVPACTRADADKTRFVDGGFFDNQPIALALSALSEISDADHAPILAFIDTDMRTWPMPLEPAVRLHDGALSTITSTLFDFIDTARSVELDRILAHDPLIGRALRLGKLYYPPASEPLNAFFGFIDKELRRFDFYLGMFHARRFLAIELGVEPAELPTEGDAKDPAWKPLFCLRALFDHDGDPKLVCAGDDLADFRILARQAIERVAEDCARAGTEGVKSPNPVCMQVAHKQPLQAIPMVDGGEAPAGRSLWPRYRRGGHEREMDWILRRLIEMGFRFHDLGVKPGEGWRAPLMLRAKLGEIVDALANSQGLLARHLYRVIGELGLNILAYTPPRFLVHVLLGNRLEVGVSWTEPTARWRWLRLELDVGLWGIDSLFSDASNWFGIAPTLGVRFEPLPLSRSLLQPRLSLHGGFLFSTTDRMLASGCDVRDSTPCSRPMAEAALSVAIISVLRLQLSAVWFPAIRAGETQRWSLTPGVAVQLPFEGRHR